MRRRIIFRFCLFQQLGEALRLACQAGALVMLGQQSFRSLLQPGSRKGGQAGERGRHRPGNRIDDLRRQIGKTGRYLRCRTSALGLRHEQSHRGLGNRRVLMVKMPGQRGFEIFLGNFLQQSGRQFHLLCLDEQMMDDLGLVQQSPMLQQGEALSVPSLPDGQKQFVGHAKVPRRDFADALFNLVHHAMQILLCVGSHAVIENHVGPGKQDLSKIIGNKRGLVGHRTRAPDNIILLRSIHRRNSLCHA